MFNSKNFQREIFCRSREIFVEAGSFDNYKPLTIMLKLLANPEHILQFQWSLWGDVS